MEEERSKFVEIAACLRNLQRPVFLIKDCAFLKRKIERQSNRAESLRLLINKKQVHHGAMLVTVATLRCGSQNFVSTGYREL